MRRTRFFLKISDFKVGQKVKCVDNQGREDELTLGKTYEILDILGPDNGTEDLLEVKSDDGFELDYGFKRFEPIDQ